MTEPERDPTETLAPARILVIDDEEIVHSSLRKILGRQGHEVTAVLSAADGIAALGRGPFDLVSADPPS